MQLVIEIHIYEIYWVATPIEAQIIMKCIIMHPLADLMAITRLAVALSKPSSTNCSRYGHTINTNSNNNVKTNNCTCEAGRIIEVHDPTVTLARVFSHTHMYIFRFP